MEAGALFIIEFPVSTEPSRAILRAPPMVRLFRHYVPRLIILMGAIEGAIIFSAIYIGLGLQLARDPGMQHFDVSHLWETAFLYAFIMMGVLAVMGLYERGLRDQLHGVLLRVGLGFVVGPLLVLFLIPIWPDNPIRGQAVVIAFVISGAGVLLSRTLFYRLADRNLFKRRILVLGAGELASQLERLRRRTDWQDARLIGYLPVPAEKQMVPKSKVLPAFGSLLDIANRYGIDEVVVAIPESQTLALPTEQLLDCKMNGIQVVDIVVFFERITGKMKLEALTPSNVVFADGFIQALHRGLVHRAFDAIISLIFLAATLPIMLLTAAAILVESGGRGPIFYRQIRVGRKGKHFFMLKFRSMRVDAEKYGTAIWAEEKDDRVTAVGALIRKAHIDELPQLVNILKGEMSFVGPRPERPEFVAELAKRIPYYELRHCVNPGLTGWAQIRYPYGASEEDAREKLQYDLYYVKNYSLFLDLTILLQTAQVVLWAKGAR
jgi:sugar transferase (PEP-CTERM system associated)